MRRPSTPLRPGPLAYIEHDGRVYTVDHGGTRTLPTPDEVSFDWKEQGRLHIAGVEVVVGSARLATHPTDWVLKDDIPMLDATDPVLKGAVLGSLYRPVTGVVAVREQTLLLVKPSRGVVEGRWTLPGGYMEPFEDPMDGAARELREETGLEAVDLKLIGAWLHRKHVQNYPVLGMVYGVREVRGTIKFSEDEIAEVRWVPLDEAFDKAEGLAFEVVRRWEDVVRGMA